MKCPYNKKIDCPHIDTSTCTKNMDCKDCETYYSSNQGCLKPSLVIIMSLSILLMFSNCTKSLVAQKSYSFSNAGYCALYYKPYKSHSPKWYKRHTSTYRYHPIKHDKLPKNGKTH